MGGGLGHLQRSIAISRHLREAAHVTILTNSPFASFAKMEGLDVITVAGSKEEIEASALAAIGRTNADLLIVDTFPAGPTGELSRFERVLPARRCLIHRRLWSYEEEHPWPTYELIVDSEPGFATDDELSVFDLAKFCQCKDTREVGPMLVRSREELLPRDEARKILGIKGNEKILLAYHHGYQKEVEALFRNTLRAFQRVSPPNWHLMTASLRPLVDKNLQGRHITYWPLVELLLAVDGVVTAGGYHSWYEAAMAQRRAIVVPMGRKYDVQSERVTEDVFLAKSPEDLERAISELCSTSTDSEALRLVWRDHSKLAAKIILEFFEFNQLNSGN